MVNRCGPSSLVWNRGVTPPVGLSTKLRDVVGGRTATALEKALGFVTVQDLLLHLPRRYSSRGELTDLASLREGELVTVMARIRSVSSRPMKQRKGTITTVVVTDGGRDLSLTFFRRPWGTKLEPGAVGLFAGKVSFFNGKPQLTHPECHMFEDSGDLLSVNDGVQDDVDAASSFANEIIAVYPATAKLASWKISQSIRMVLDQIDWSAQIDPLPAAIRQRQSLLSQGQAYEVIHRPRDVTQAQEGLRRIRWDEALALQTVLALRRRALSAYAATPRRTVPGGLLAAFDEQLAFTLTDGQSAIGDVLFDELASEHPMHRLLQGEVGSGKTLVALRAMLAVVDAGGQAALLAPTEVLATQHARSIRDLLGPLAEGGMIGAPANATRVALVTGSAPVATKRAELLAAASGEAGIVVGTHALLEEHVTFADLGLVVVDEQHRFGVQQRAAMTSKSRQGQRPHVLVMTATPIPRTVAITVFGDLEVSVLRELPKGRAPISTHVVPTIEKPTFLQRAWERIREEVAAGRQAYIVCPQISTAEGADDPDALAQIFDVQDDQEQEPGPPPVAVEDLARDLAIGPLAGLRVATLHGRMTGAEKDLVMRRFSGDPMQPEGVDVLVSTTVIEVGVDVANATVMVVMDADRFGVSALHQLRGRIGRGGYPGLCLLVTAAAEGSPSRERLEAVAATTDGFELAHLDLTNRREGDVLGVEQSGRRSSLRALSLLRDEEIIVAARAEAQRLVDDDPELRDHRALAELASDLVGPEGADWLDRS